MIAIDTLILFIGLGALIGSLLHIVIAFIFIQKNRQSIISKAFSSFFIFIAISIFEISMYNIFPLSVEGMKFVFSSLFIFSMFGIFSLVLGVRQLVFPTKNPFKTILIPIMGFLTICVFLLSITDVEHVNDLRYAIYSPLFIISFILNYEIPMGYIIFQLSVKRDWISEERQLWFKNLRYFFIINCFYPIIEGISGFSKELRFLDVVNGIFIFTSIILLISLPSYKSWYLDELKTITVIKHLNEHYKGSLEELWVKMNLWQEKFEQTNKQLTMPEFQGYLMDIENTLEIKIK